MDFSEINVLAVVVAAVVSFVFGAVYYTVLRKPWLAALGTTEEEIKQTTRWPAAPFITEFVALLVMAFVLAGHLGQSGPASLSAGRAIESAALLWLGCVASAQCGPRRVVK